MIATPKRATEKSGKDRPSGLNDRRRWRAFESNSVSGERLRLNSKRGVALWVDGSVRHQRLFDASPSVGHQTTRSSHR